MSNQKSGGPAFPSHGSMGEVVEEGMTLRDYFAAAFLAGFARTYNAPDAPETKEEQNSVAILCYGIADAMLEARKQ